MLSVLYFWSPLVPIALPIALAAYAYRWIIRDFESHH